MNVGEFLGKLSGVKKASNGWEARCPAHEDTHASLSVREGDDGRVLVHCFAGCSVETIVGGLGLKLTDLFSQGAGNGWLPRRRIVAT